MSRAMEAGRHIIEGLRDAAKKKREAARAEMLRAQRVVEHADIEVAAFEKALAALADDDDVSPPTPTSPLRFYGATVLGGKTAASFSDKWVAVFRDMFNHATEPYTYDDVMSAANRQGSTSGMNSLRAQMMKAVDSGLFERVEAGKFKITEFGLETIGAGQKENEPPKGGSEAEEASTSSNAEREMIHGDPRGLFS